MTPRSLKFGSEREAVAVWAIKDRDGKSREFIETGRGYNWQGPGGEVRAEGPPGMPQTVLLRPDLSPALKLVRVSEWN